KLEKACRNTSRTDSASRPKWEFRPTKQPDVRVTSKPCVRSLPGRNSGSPTTAGCRRQTSAMPVANIFIDTNVLLYSIDETELVKGPLTQHWLLSLSRNGAGRTNLQVLNEATSLL